MSVEELLAVFVKSHIRLGYFSSKDTRDNALSFLTGYSAAIKQIEQQPAEEVIRDYYRFKEQAERIRGEIIPTYRE